MQNQSSDQLAAKKCQPCSGKTEKIGHTQADEQLKSLSGWQLTHGGERIRKNWTVKDFLAGLTFFNAVGKLAEAEDHHPDLHLEGYRNLWIELSTHAVGGLSENDFILAAKIDRLPVELKKVS
ncbi:MAG TPA: 4a-hydroxytetrahydrobiopterin dehydratase [Pirellulales bacterium]|jgi:4a-hydroxytetrahydrobiopterin dehydratase